jgi:hypothetical protein
VWECPSAKPVRRPNLWITETGGGSLTETDLSTHEITAGDGNLSCELKGIVRGSHQLEGQGETCRAAKRRVPPPTVIGQTRAPLTPSSTRCRSGSHVGERHIRPT